jgi:hypothetical protein
MAVFERSSTKNANRLISYCEKRAEVIGEHNVLANFAKSQFTAQREAYNKNDGVQAHHYIQSFDPRDSLTPEKANELGLEMANRLFPDYQVVVYTHADKNHLHNHIVINSVNFEGGKFNADKKSLYEARKVNDDIAREHNLSVIDSKEKRAPETYHRAEYGLANRGIQSWKDEIREAVSKTKEETSNLEELCKKLEEQYEIKTRVTNKTITFTHPDEGKKVRGSKLGHSYEKQELENFFKERGFEEHDLTSKIGESTRGNSKTEDRERYNSEKSLQDGGEFEERNYGESRAIDEIKREYGKGISDLEQQLERIGRSSEKTDRDTGRTEGRERREKEATRNLVGPRPERESKERDDGFSR